MFLLTLVYLPHPISSLLRRQSFRPSHTLDWLMHCRPDQHANWFASHSATNGNKTITVGLFLHLNTRIKVSLCGHFCQHLLVKAVPEIGYETGWVWEKNYLNLSFSRMKVDRKLIITVCLLYIRQKLLKCRSLCNQANPTTYSQMIRN